MSCKRADIRNLIGCRIGEVAIRGCGRECCPYDDDKVNSPIMSIVSRVQRPRVLVALHCPMQISENTRNHLLSNSTASYRHADLPTPPGRTGLHYIACQTSWRQKFICLKPTCRRGIKPAYNPDKNDYRISEYGDWEVRPKREREPGLKTTFDNQARLISKGMQGTEEKAEIEALWKKYLNDDEKGLDNEELDRLKMYRPDLWWQSLISIPRYGVVEKNMMRCPSCGDRVVRVGSNFRLPKRSDERAWKEIEGMFASGEDMFAKFSVCSTLEVHKEMLEEAQMRAAKEETEGPWLEEKRNRVRALGLQPKECFNENHWRKSIKEGS